MRLELRGVSYSHGSAQILKAVSVTAESGEFIALMGANGAGKSTLLDLMAGLRRPQNGTVEVDGRSLSAWPARQIATRLSHLPQSVGADLPFQAGQLVAMGRYPYSENWHESEIDREQVESAMRRANCFEFQHRRLTTLSGGERQRVLLAACLAQAAEALLLDEPSTFLDVDQQLQCFALLKEQAAAQTLCIAVTHDLNLALAHCTRIIVLADRQVAADISVQEAAAAPAWLKLFSGRLQMGATPTGRPWVWFE